MLSNAEHRERFPDPPVSRHVRPKLVLPIYPPPPPKGPRLQGDSPERLAILRDLVASYGRPVSTPEVEAAWKLGKVCPFNAATALAAYAVMGHCRRVTRGHRGVFATWDMGA